LGEKCLGIADYFARQSQPHLNFSGIFLMRCMDHLGSFRYINPFLGHKSFDQFLLAKPVLVFGMPQ